MDRKPLKLAGILLTLLTLGCNAAGAADLLGLYVGGAVGEADVNSQQSFNSVPFDFDVHHNAWKAMLGVRPISLVGAEIEYVDFGQPHRNSVLGEIRVKDKAAVLSGLLYVPLPVPYFDVLGKVGLARLESDVTAHFPITCVVQSPNVSAQSHGYAAGLRWRRADQDQELVRTGRIRTHSDKQR